MTASSQLTNQQQLSFIASSFPPNVSPCHGVTAPGKTHCTRSEVPRNLGASDGGSWGAICDSTLELSLEVMIRNQNRQDNQCCLLMHV